LGLGAAIAGLAVMGADPPPMPPLPVKPLSHEALAAKLLPTPRLFKMELTRQGEPTSEAQICMGAETMRAALGGVEARHEAAPARSPSTGCVQSLAKTADGWNTSDRVCDKLAGAERTSHITTESRGDMSEVRTHLEMQAEVDGKPRTIVQQTHMTMLGDCPADLKPGQMRLADGKVVDFPRVPSAAAKPPTTTP
jgi:hypothetical protein